MKKTLLLSLLLATAFASAQPSFPRIEPAVQAARDTDRAAILLQERVEETKLLQVAEKALASGAPDEKDKQVLTVERHRKNLAALDAEIQRAGGAAAPAATVASAGPVRLKAVAVAPAAAPADTPAPYWDVHRRHAQAQPAGDAAAASDTVPYWDVFRRKEQP
jgi:hypothetical protein